MRIDLRAAELAIALLLGANTLAALPGAAHAEWTAVSWPCNVEPGAIMPPPVTQFATEEPVLPPTGYFTYGAGPFAPASQFTATANWGDGTISSATVDDKAIGGCYEVSTSDHTYANPGTYQFSYTIHDEKTGLDHTLAATQWKLWSNIPHPLTSPSTHEVKATIGKPWSGVVADFSSEAPALGPTFPYTAEIEWGDGEPSTPGTISPQGGGTFTVSGSVTYARPFRGQITVAISTGVYSSTRLLGSWATSSVDVNGTAVLDLTPPGPVRIHGQSILAAIIRAGRAPLYELVFRTSQPLSKTRSGHVEAKITIHDKSSSVSELSTHSTSAGSECYVAHTNAPLGHQPKPGAGYPFELTVHASPSTRVNGHAQLRRFSSFAHMRSATSRLLGCA